MTYFMARVLLSEDYVATNGVTLQGSQGHLPRTKDLQNRWENPTTLEQPLRERKLHAINMCSSFLLEAWQRNLSNNPSPFFVVTTNG